MAPNQALLSSYYSERKADTRTTRSQKLTNKSAHDHDVPDKDGDILLSPKRTPTRAKIRSCRAESSCAGIQSSQVNSASKQQRMMNSEMTYTHRNCEEINRGAPLPDEEGAADLVYSPKLLSPSKRRLKTLKEPCSPPKIKCSEPHNNLPDVSSNVTTATPSTMMKELTLISPTSDQKKKSSLPPKSLFPDSDDILAKARNALHTHSKTSLPGREKELKELQEFIQTHLQNEKSGSLYISGPPGTGKTACLTKVLEQPNLKQDFKIVNINCTSFGSPKAIYSRIADQLSINVRVKSGKAYQEGIEKCLHSNRKMILMVLDEMDQLDTRSQSVLYTIFEWPMNYPTGIILIGIANALDLTDRLLPRLKAKLQLIPQLLHFAPYTKQQLVDIFLSRLEEADASTVFHPAALQLLASKLSAVNGDARRALDTARRAVEKESQRLFDAKIDAQTPSKAVMATALLSNSSPVRKSPRQAMLAVPHQYLNQEKGNQANTLSSPKMKSPIASPLKSPFKSPIRQSYSAKENCSPMKPKSAKKCLFGSDGGVAKQSPISKMTSIKNTSDKKEPNIDVVSIMNVVNDVYGTSQGLGRITEGGEELPLHHKLAICTLLLILREGKSKDVTVGKLHDVYRRVCNKRHIESLDSSAFLSMLGLVEARGVILLPGRGKRSRLTKICMQWIEDEVVAALKDRDLLAAILRDKSCLS